MKDVFQLEPNTVISRENSYILSYPYILSYFQRLDKFTEGDFVCGAHIIYGWMPTVLDLYPKTENAGLSIGAKILTSVKNDGKISNQELECLAALVNNSLVGASKLLHFTAPKKFAIWDSKIYSFVFEEKPHNYRVNKLSKYREYLSRLNEIKQQPNFSSFHASVNNKMGYEVTPLRAIEVIMFLNSN